MGDHISGTCNCGRHKFTIARPTEMNLCHCLDCTKWAGAFHSAHLLLKTANIRNDGPEPKKWHVKAESGTTMERAFCEECGTGLWIRKVDGKEETTNLKAGLFDRKDICNPTMENWMKNMEDWETPAKGTKRQAVDGN